MMRAAILAASLTLVCISLSARAEKYVCAAGVCSLAGEGATGISKDACTAVCVGSAAERKAQVEALVGAPTAVYASYYACLSSYFKLLGPADAFYNAALSMLAYTPVEAMAPATAHELAVDLALAALAGESVFNFGEVITTPILGALEGTPEAWLGGLLHALNRGDVDRFKGAPFHAPLKRLDETRAARSPVLRWSAPAGSNQAA